MTTIYLKSFFNNEIELKYKIFFMLSKKQNIFGFQNFLLTTMGHRIQREDIHAWQALHRSFDQ
jgi:hypothetical protein